MWGACRSFHVRTLSMAMSVFMEASASTSQTLLQRVQQHQPAAWERFSQLYGPLVYRWCATAGLQPQDAADVMQEVFQAVFLGISRFQSQSAGQSLRGWLWTITRNKTSDHFRRRQKEPRAAGGSVGQNLLDRVQQLPETDGEPLEAIVGELSHRALTLIQSDFEATTWQAFWAIAVEGLSPADAAARVGVTTAAAYKAKSRVLNRLRHELDGLLE